MQIATIEELFGIEAEIIAPDYTELLFPTRAALGRVLLDVPASVEIAGAFGRVVIANVTPRAIPDPPIPVILGEVSESFYWAMRRWWRSLLWFIGGWPVAGIVRRRARVVLASLGGLSEAEREFFERALWGAMLGDAK